MKMPKDETEQSYKRSRVSPFPRRSCTIGHKRQCSSIENTKWTADLKEWEEARCPVCMDHPHNAVLLFCSSHGKGCRPYMCDTSSRHSNCLDQFRKAFGSWSGSRSAGQLSLGEQIASGGVNMVSQNKHTFVPCSDTEKQNLSCPLCRGQIKGWFAIEAARKFMNDKTKSCSHESCSFSGNYADLRKHARKEHPLARPQEVDPERQRDWRRSHEEQDLLDEISTIIFVYRESGRNQRFLELITPFLIDFATLET